MYYYENTLKINYEINSFFYSCAPEIFLSIAILTQILLNIYAKKYFEFEYSRFHIFIFFQCCIILIGTIFISYNFCNYEYVNPSSFIINTRGTIILKRLIFIFALFVLIPIYKSFNLQKLTFFEYYTFYLFSILSSALLVSASDFLTVYLLIEMQSLCFYILAVFKKNSQFSVEAALKYFIFGSIISCIFLFGLSILYGSLGTLNFFQINSFVIFLSDDVIFEPLKKSVLFSLVILCIVLFFKIGIVPFHFWIPDVYEGTSAASTIIFSIIPKLALFDLFIKIAKTFDIFFNELNFIFFFVGILSAVVGTFFSLLQKRLKRFLIYTSIAQMGYPIILLGLGGSIDPVRFIYYYIIFYTMSSIMLWTNYINIYEYIERDVTQNELIVKSAYTTDLNGLFYLNPILSVMFSINFFSLAGIPPLGGFFLKFFVIYELVENNLITLAFLMLLISSISIYYYIRIIKIMFFENIQRNYQYFKFIFKSFPFSTTSLAIYNDTLILIIQYIVLEFIFFLDCFGGFSTVIFFSLFYGTN